MAKDEKNKKRVKEPKNNFFKESKAELKKVNWPKSKSLANDTATVIGIVLVVAILVMILDFIFININENVIIKAEEKIKANNSSVTTELDQSTSNNTENETNSEENSENNNSETVENANQNTDQTSNAE